MKKLFEFEYRGLNLLDEISTVEIMINKEDRTVHIFDQNNVVEPEFYFSKNDYQLCENFFRMAQVLFNKKFIVFNRIDHIEQWINQFKWIFYGSKNVILIYDSEKVSILCKIDELDEEKQEKFQLYSKYVKKILSL